MDSLGLSPFIPMMFNSSHFEVSSFRFWYPCKRRARAQKPQSFDIWFSCVPFTSETVDCTISHLVSGATACLRPIGTSMSEATKTIRFLKLKNLTFFLSFSTPLLHISLTSVLLTRSSNIAMSNLVRKSSDQSSRIMFSCAWVFWILHLFSLSKGIPKLNSFRLPVLICWKTKPLFPCSSPALKFSLA